MAAIVGFLNTHKPSVKLGLQWFQLAALHVGLYTIARKKLYPDERDDAVGPIGRAAYGAALVGFVFTALTTPLVASRISRVVGLLFSDAALLRWLGPNATFAENWKHPRHIVSLTGALLILPAAIRCWVGPTPQLRYHRGLQWAAYVSLLTSRPGVHVLNALAHKVFRRAP